jgi:RNA-directed DNA polymerase
MERRGQQKVDQFRLSPAAPANGPYKGYEKIDWINSRSERSREAKFCSLMHHFSPHNLKQAFRDLQNNAAPGIDQVTKDSYRRDLVHNLENLREEIRRGGWRPRPSREVLIPKAQGGFRPLAVGCLEDKIVQQLAAKILEALFEPEFHQSSYGFRFGKSAHMAVAKVYRAVSQRPNNCVVVEMDIEKYFNSIPHDKLMACVEKKISDQRFLRLVRRMLRNSILTSDDKIARNVQGTPQGSPISPVLANIYLHYMLDEWFSKNFAEKAEIVRYADDAVFVFTDKGTALEFKERLKSHLENEAGLRLNDDKSDILRFDSKTRAGVFCFLGFRFHWSKKPLKPKYLRVMTDPRSLRKGVQTFKVWIKQSRSRLPLAQLWEQAAAKLTGHYNYFGVSFNRGPLFRYYNLCIRELYKWINRRSQKRSYTWGAFLQRLRYKPLPLPTKGERLLKITNGLGIVLKHQLKSRMRKLRTYGSERSYGRQLPLFT